MIMINVDSYLEKITPKKKAIIQGILASDNARVLLHVIGMSVLHVQSEKKSYLYAENEEFLIPSRYKSVITCSSQGPEGIVTIPGFFKLIDEISDAILVTCEGLKEGISLHVPSHYQDGWQVTVQLASFYKRIRDPDFILEYPDLSTLWTTNHKEEQSLIDLLSVARTILIGMYDFMEPEKNYGAYCYLTDTMDRYLIRAFMQGILRFNTDSDDPEYPLIVVFRDNNKLFIGLFIREYSKEYFIIEINQLTIHIRVLSRFPCIYNFATRLHGLPGVLIQKKFSGDKVFQNSGNAFLIESGIFHSRSNDEMMQFLADTGYHLLNYDSEFSPCGKIAG